MLSTEEMNTFITKVTLRFQLKENNYSWRLSVIKAITGLTTLIKQLDPSALKTMLRDCHHGNDGVPGMLRLEIDPFLKNVISWS